MLILYPVLFSGESKLSQQGMAESCHIWWPDPGLPAMGLLSQRVPQLCWDTDLQFWLRLCVTSRWWMVYIQDLYLYMYLDLYLNRCQWRRRTKNSSSQRICLLLALKEGQFLHRSCRALEGGCCRADVFICISVWPCPSPWLCLHSRRVSVALWYQHRPCSLSASQESATQPVTEATTFAFIWYQQYFHLLSRVIRRIPSQKSSQTNIRQKIAHHNSLAEVSETGSASSQNSTELIFKLQKGTTCSLGLI